jgi:hypothetical protein
MHHDHPPAVAVTLTAPRSSRLRLVGDHGEFHAERTQYGANGFIARMGAAAESLVKALAAEAGILSDPGHSVRLGHVAERGEKRVGIGISTAADRYSAMTASLSR